MTRAALARKVGIDTPRLAHYEHGRVALPYHVGARLIEALGLCQRWVATGEGPQRGYFAVGPVVADLIPKSMQFSEAYDLVMADEITAHHVEFAKHTKLPMEKWGQVYAGRIGEHETARRRRYFLAGAHQMLDALLPHLHAKSLAKFTSQFHILINRFLGCIDDLETQEVAGGSLNEREQEEVFRKYHAKLKAWVPPGRGRRRH